MVSVRMTDLTEEEAALRERVLKNREAVEAFKTGKDTIGKNNKREPRILPDLTQSSNGDEEAAI